MENDANLAQFTAVPELGCSEHGPYIPPPLVIGRAPTYQPVPGPLPVVRQTGPDTVVDGADLSGLAIRGASIRGDYHRYEGTPRQDAMGIWQLDENRILVCVADGLGSRELSHIGAETACRAAFEKFDRDHPKEAEAYFADISDEIVRRAETEGVAPEQLATTLTVAVIDISPEQSSNFCWILRVGDATAMRLHRGVWLSCFPEENDSAVTSSATHALPMDAQHVELATISLRHGDVLLLCTDGLAKPMTGSPVRDQLAAWWSAEAPPSLPEFHWQLSFRVRSHDDDRTAICVWGASE